MEGVATKMITENGERKMLRGIRIKESQERFKQSHLIIHLEKNDSY